MRNNDKRTYSKNKLRVFFILELIISGMIAYIAYITLAPNMIALLLFGALLYSPIERLDQKLRDINFRYKLKL